MIDVIKAILFGIIEGITEWLPISSTGHLILFEEFIKVDSFSKKFFEFFLVFIQLGAILAVVIMFFNRLNPLSKKKTKEEKQDTWQTWFKVFIACLPAAIVGLFLDDFLNETFYNFITVSITLVIYGVLFIIIENKNKNKEFKINEMSKMTYKTALLIGACQLLALIPGTSRSGVTILGAMLLGANRVVSAEFSFFLSIPVMIGASLLKGVRYFLNNSITTPEILFLSIGFLVSFIVSIFTIKLLLKYIKGNDFKVFGYYRIALGLILISYFLFFLM